MRLTLALIVFVVGCAASDDPCRSAAEHIASCTHEPAAVDGNATCDPERADSILAMDCEQVAAAAAAGKADGWWDDFLCSLGFTSHCSGSASTARTLTGNVYKIGTVNEAAGHVYVRATREGTTETKGAWTVNGLFVIPGLTAARYRIEVAYTTTANAIANQTIDLARQSYITIYAPVP